MAITQQLARLSAEYLDACRASVDKLDDLCSFRLLPARDHLDLDWAAGPLLRCFELPRFTEPTTSVLRRAINGDSEINPAYRFHPNTVFEHPVTALDPDSVAEVATTLVRASTTVLTAIPDDVVLALRDLEGHPTSYLSDHLGALRDFYTEAADRTLAVALWCD